MHTAGYIEAVQAAGAIAAPGSRHTASVRRTIRSSPACTRRARWSPAHRVAAAQAVVAGDSDHGVNISGGLHHAMPDRASGFCVYNDPAIAIAWLLTQGVERVAYVDIDVHHGDGVQAIFWDDPRVLTISLHESGRTLFPGTGFAAEIGGPNARGTRAQRRRSRRGRATRSWHAAFDAVVPAALRRFAPEYLVTQHGCDTHALDPLANLLLTVDGQRSAHAKVHDLAHEVCDGRWLAVGGGGYELVQVVPRSWTHLLAIATGEPLDPRRPLPRRTGASSSVAVPAVPAPTRMTDLARRPDPRQRSHDRALRRRGQSTSRAPRQLGCAAGASGADARPAHQAAPGTAAATRR